MNALARWLPFGPPAVQKRAMFCFPYAGGRARIFKNWQEVLPGLSVCPVELPGRGDRVHEPPFISLKDLVAELAGQISPVLDRPFIIFGHSMGALIAFELTRTLLARGLRPEKLLISAQRAPQLPRTDLSLHQLPDQELIDNIRCFNGTPQELLDDPETLAKILPLVRADFALWETYIYEAAPPLPIPIVAFGGLNDPIARRSAVSEWRAQTTESFTLRLFPGDHFFIHGKEALVLDELRRELGER